jgi:hypothetical protein
MDNKELLFIPMIAHGKLNSTFNPEARCKTFVASEPLDFYVPTGAPAEESGQNQLVLFSRSSPLC